MSRSPDRVTAATGPAVEDEDRSPDAPARAVRRAASRPRLSPHGADAGLYYVAAVIAAIGAALLVAQWAGGRMLWVDEEMIAINIRDRTLRQLAGPLSLGQAAPYGWLVVERLLVLLAGTGERVLRFPPMAFGVATLAAALWIGRRSMTGIGAIALAFLCSFGQWISFHALELKHYSADVCFALLMPALAAWAVEPAPERVTDGAAAARSIDRRRIFAWWAVAAIAQWFANGALFVAPACAAVLAGVSVRQYGWRATLRACAPGALLWIVSFAGNYLVALGPARANGYLREFWASAYPPAAGVVPTLRWLASQWTPLAIKPGGSGYPIGFWAFAFLGLAAAPGYPLAFRLAFGLVPLSAFLWAGLRLVPMYERLSLWIVPACYVGLAAAAELAARGAIDARPRRIRQTVLGGALAALLIVMFVDFYQRGMTYVTLGRHTANHEQDDRGGVRWLARQRQPGDVWVTTHMAAPAVWWYAGADASPMVEASLNPDAPHCGTADIETLKANGTQRLLVYLGFAYDVPPGFGDTLVARLGTLGTVAAYRPFGPGAHALVVDLTHGSSSRVTLATLAGRGTAPPGSAGLLDGCITIEPARRW